MLLRAAIHRAEWALYRLVYAAISLLPHGVVRRLGHAVGGALYYIKGGRRRLTLANLTMTLTELDARARRRIARACFQYHGATMLETVSASRFDRKDLDYRFDIEGWENLEAADAGGRGLFVMTGHYGAWDMAAYPVGLRLGELHLLVRLPRNPYLRRDLQAIRGRWGNVLLPRAGASHRMLNVLRRGGRIAILIDQRTQPENGILIPFLGRPAWTSVILARLSIHQQAPVVPVFCVPIAGGRYRVTIHPAIEPEGKGEDAEAVLTQRYLETVEREIRGQPEYWFWPSRRWQLTMRYRFPKRLQRLLEDSRLPPEETLAALDRRLLTGPQRRTLRKLMRGAFLELAENILLTGPHGSGKTHLGCDIGRHLVRTGYAVRFSRATDLARDLLAAEEEGRLASTLHKLDGLEMLIVDAIDRLQPGSRESGVLMTLLEQRRQRRSVLITSRLPLLEWGSTFGDTTLSSSLIESLRQQSTVLELPRPASPSTTTDAASRRAVK